ncbi:MAG TPA: phosphoribosylglycinamide formyltransferase [Gemmatimonadota bacterium]|jgi:phosphoribosylglycinamide formyltransferase-1
MSAAERFRIAVFASGGGSNLGALLERFPPGGEREVALVVSDRADAGALARASAAGVPTRVVRPRDFATPEEYSLRLVGLLRDNGIDLIVLAGFLRKVPAGVVEAFPFRVVNVHPALLPRFGGEGMYGERVHAAVLAAGERESGASVHFVDAEYDRGPVIVQARVPVLPEDTPASLARRVLEEEHRLLPEVVDLIASGRVSVAADGTVVVRRDASAAAAGKEAP